jgi:hypothetical protein
VLNTLNKTLHQMLCLKAGSAFGAASGVWGAAPARIIPQVKKQLCLKITQIWHFEN